MAPDGISGQAPAVAHVAADEDRENSINDEQFIRDLKRLKELRSFLIQEAINISPGDSSPLSFGRLNLLRYSLSGRAPTEMEWSEVEQHTQTLFRLLSDPLRRRFILGEIPAWISMLPILLAFLAFAALVIAVGFPESQSNIRTLLCYLVWLASLGAIGSVAFIGMNALSVQQDVTFDLSNRRLMLLRIALGALFGLVLTLPFGFQGFTEFMATVAPARLNADAAPQKTAQAMLLLLPFLFGFSTSLVIMVLNRLVDAVQAFFGRIESSERSPMGPSSVSPSSPGKTGFTGRP